MARFNVNDWSTAHNTWKRLQESCDSPDCQTEDGGWPECDCRSSEVIMLSTGYAEVWLDGDVTQYGCVAMNVSR